MSKNLSKKKKLKIKKPDLSDPKQRAKFDKILKKVSKKFEKLEKANRESSRITAADLAIIINAT